MCIRDSSREEMDQVLAALKDAAFSVTDVKKGERTKKAPLPFTTSTLQQEASKAVSYTHLDVYKRQMWTSNDKYYE